MSEPNEHEAGPGEAPPETDQSAYGEDAVPLAEEELSEDDLKGEAVHPTAPGDHEPEDSE